MALFDKLKNNRQMQNAVSEHTAANDLSKRGKPAEAAKKYEEALKLYREAYAEGGRKTEFLMSFAILLMRYGEFAEAREIMKTAAENKAMSDDTHFKLRVNYSACLWRLGLLDEAIKTVRYAGKHAKNSDYYSFLGTYLVDQARRTGDFAPAKELLDEAMGYDDEDAATLDNIGEYYLALSEKAAAENDEAACADYRRKSKEFYEKALRQKPGQVTTLYALACFARDEGNTAKAKELAERALLHSGSKLCPVSNEMIRALL